MKRKMICTVLMLGIILTFTSCKAGTVDSEQGAETDTMAVPPFEEFSDEQSEEARAYYDFMTGKRQACIGGQYWGIGDYDEWLADREADENGKKWVALGELMEKIDFWPMQYCNYAWLDCGNDGRRELGVSLRAGGPEGEAVNLVFAYNYGELEFTYCFEENTDRDEGKRLGYYGTLIGDDIEQTEGKKTFTMLDKWGFEREVYVYKKAVLGTDGNYVDKDAYEEMFPDGPGHPWKIIRITIGDDDYYQYERDRNYELDEESERKFYEFVDKCERRGKEFCKDPYMDWLISQREEQFGYTSSIKDDDESYGRVLEWIEAPWLGR